MTLKNRTAILVLVSLSLLQSCSNVIHKKPTSAAPEASNKPIVTVEPAPELIARPKYETLWDRLRDGYALPTVSDAVVADQLRWYANNQSYITRFINQGEPYLHYIVTELQAAGMPLELALLPVVESCYDPSVNSPSNAAGIWQFIPLTGKNYGLAQNSWYDGRRDVLASTDAAIRYLKRLNTLFDNDWLLALAAYNAGEGTVMRAIDANRRKGKPTDFWSLNLAKQTETYVPQIVALAKIIADPAKYDIKVKPIPDNPYFAKINVDSQINIAQVAKGAGIDLEQLKKLNAGYKGWLTDPTQARPLLVPIADAAAFTEQLDLLPKLPSVQWREHVVKKGDNLGSIAKHYGSSVDKIVSANHVKPTGLSLGQRLQIPVSPNMPDPVSLEADKLLAERKSQRDPNAKNYYVVKSGDNLWTIARDQKMSVENLAQINAISTKTTLQLGQKLLVLNNTPDPQRKITYTIKAGDTLTKIASRFNVSTKDILAWNNVKDESYIHPNQELVIMVGTQIN